jgi:hypothetical protein
MALPPEVGDREVQKFVETDAGRVAVRIQDEYVNGVSTDNSTTTSLAGNATYTGTWVDVSGYDSVMTATKADQTGTLYMEFSETNTGSARSSLTYSIAANINEVHRLSVTNRYYRTRFVNDSTDQTDFMLTTLFGGHTALAAPSNLTQGLDADAVMVRVISEETDIARNKRSGMKIVNKFGRNPDIDTASVPEDIWAAGGVYTGFPVGDDELVTLVSSSVNDAAAGSGARTVRIYGLDTDGNEQDEVMTLNGTTLVDSANTYTRVNRLIVLTSGSSNQAFNDGTLTVAHKTTTANVFVVVPAGFNQSQVLAYTIPAGKTGYMRHLMVEVKRSTSASIDGALWVRNNGASPRLTRIFSATQAEEHQIDVLGGVVLDALTDVTVRITSCSANNITVTGQFDLMLVDN